MDDTTKAKISANLANSWKMASNWVITASGAMFAIYLSLPVEQQQALINHLPVAPWVIPIVTSALGFVARMWPQKSIASPAAAPQPPDEPAP